VQIALARAHDHVEVRDAACCDVERRDVASDHPAVEDHGGVGAPVVGLDELDDRVATALLLAVAAEAHVDRKLACPGELAGGREQQVELAFVVDRAPAVEILTSHRGLKRRGVPELERVGRLHVEVAVAEHRRRVAPARRRQLPNHERLAAPVHDPAVASRAAHEVAYPARRLLHIVRARRVGADRRDA